MVKLCKNVLKICLKKDLHCLGKTAKSHLAFRKSVIFIFTSSSKIKPPILSQKTAAFFFYIFLQPSLKSMRSCSPTYSRHWHVVPTKYLGHFPGRHTTPSPSHSPTPPPPPQFSPGHFLRNPTRPNTNP